MILFVEKPFLICELLLPFVNCLFKKLKLTFAFIFLI